MWYYIDIVDACNLRCPTCVRGGRFLKNTGGKMPLDKFKKILIKAKANSASVIALYNWTEPFLHPRLPDFIRIVKNHDLNCHVSSNLSLPKIPNLKETLEAGPFELQVSVSGFTNDIHTINHKGSDINIVKKHLVEISKILPELDHEVTVEVKYLTFDYNQHQIDGFKSWVDDIGLDFIAHKGEGDPKERTDKQVFNRYITVHSTDMASTDLAFLNPCKLLFDMFVLDHRGEAFLCCAYESNDLYRVGDFLETPFQGMMLSRLFHPKCRTCISNRRKITGKDICNLNSWFSDIDLFVKEPGEYKRITEYSSDIRKITWEEDKISIVSTGYDPHFTLPESAVFEDGKSYLVQIEIEAPADTEVQLFYASAGDTFSGKRRISHHLKAGNNHILMNLYNIRARGKTKLRLDPGACPGNYVITGFKIFEVA